MAVYPANDSALVTQLGEILGADLDVIMSLNNLDGESLIEATVPPCLPEVASRNGSLGKALLGQEALVALEALIPKTPVTGSGTNSQGRGQR